MKLGDVKVTMESFGSEEGGSVGAEGTPELPEGAVKPTEDHGEVQENQPGPGEETPSETEIVQDVEQDAAVVQEAMVVSEKTESAAEQLEQLAESAKQVVDETGTIPAPSAAMIQTTLESIHKTLGTEAPVLPSMEAYQGTFSKGRASQLTLESIDNSKKGIWRTVVDALKAVANAAIGFLAKLFQNRALMERHLLKLLERAKKLEPSAKKPEELRGRFVHGLEFEGETNVYTAERVLSTANWLVKDFEHACRTVEYLRNYAGTDDIAEYLHEVEQKAMDPEFLKVGEAKVHGKVQEIFGALPNGDSIYFDRTTGETGTVSNRPAGVEAPEYANALSKGECVAILEQAIRVLRELRSSESRCNRLGDHIKSIIKNVEVAFNDLRGAMGDKEIEERNKRLKVAREARRVFSKTIGRNPSFIFSAVKHASEYARRSISSME